MKHSFYIPTHIFYGAGCLDKLGEIKLPGKKALIVTTSSTRFVECGYFDRLKTLLKRGEADAILYDKVCVNPSKAQVEEATELFLKEGCDMVLGFGGGSSIDTAKAVAMLAANGGDLWDYVQSGSGRGAEIKVKPYPIIAVSTTAGTGTESDPWIVITKEDTNEKLGLGSADMFATYAFLDAELMVTVPQKLTAYQGFDALFHAMEGYIATTATPVSDIFALKSISLIGKSLVRAYENGQDIHAREEMAMASSLSGIVESISYCTGNHSIAQAMAAYYNQIPHGAALLMTANEYFRHFEPIVPERFADMAKALTGNANADTEDLLGKLIEMENACGVDTLTMSDYGITEDMLSVIADNAYDWQYDQFEVGPVPMTKAEVLNVLKKSYR